MNSDRAFHLQRDGDVIQVDTPTEHDLFTSCWGTEVYIIGLFTVCIKKAKENLATIYICIKQMRWGAGQGKQSNQKTTILEENICKFNLQKAPFFNI